MLYLQENTDSLKIEGQVKLSQECLDYLKQTRITHTNHLQFYWALRIFQDNIHPLCQTLAIDGQATPNIEGATSADYVLKPPSVVFYRKALLTKDNTKPQGIGPYHNQGARFYHELPVHGTAEKCFTERYNKDTTK